MWVKIQSMPHLRCGKCHINIKAITFAFIIIYWFNIWDYNIIPLFSLLLSSLQTLLYTPLCLNSNSWPFLLCYMHTCIHIYISKYNLFSLYTVACVCARFQGKHCNWIPIHVLPGEDLHSQHSLVTHSHFKKSKVWKRRHPCRSVLSCDCLFTAYPNSDLNIGTIFFFKVKRNKLVEIYSRSSK